MRTVKKRIVVLIVADRFQVEEALNSASEASIYADVVYVALPRTGKIEEAKLDKIQATARTKAAELKLQALNGKKPA
ncbi:hypothetical protein LCGC14_2532190, partial [marine sediment metagenome]